MKTSSITVTIVVPWWWRGYVRACAVFAALHGLEVDTDKACATLLRHLKVKTS